MLVVHLDSLDVITAALPSPSAPTPDAIVPPPTVREDVELFVAAVMPPLFAYVAEAPLSIVVGLLGLVLDRTMLANVARTKIGLGVLTMFVSRAELVKQAAGATPDADWRSWQHLYDTLFNAVEPVLPYLFPGGEDSVRDADDMYVWQFLAAMGVGASPDQQQRLVLGVKDRVMRTVEMAKVLPEMLRERRLGDVNLFMRAIGLDVELLG